MSKLLVVFGATGKQGGSVVSHVLADATLSNDYTVRGITRDPSSAAAQALSKQNVEVVQAEINDKPSLLSALKGAHTVFGLTAPSVGPGAKERERAGGKDLADSAVAAGAQYLIFSTLPHVTTASGGKYTKVASFDAQAEVADYIRTLPIKSAFFSPGSFMSNFHSIMAPRPAGDGTYIMARHVSPQTKLPLIDTAGDTGKYVGAILAEPEKYENKTFCSASGMYSMDEMAEIIGKATGKTVKYKQVSVEQFRKALAPTGVAPWVDVLVEMMLYQQDFGYYGPETKEKVEWAVENARGKVTSFEKYLELNPLQLQ